MTEQESRLSDMVKSGELLLIPVGFRCYTRREINTRLKLSRTRPSLPFDHGFFTPQSVASLLNDPLVSLTCATHLVCKKIENFTNQTLKFETSSYEEIDFLFEQTRSNKYLDTSLCYYTLDTKHKFVLAHYNWHKASKEEPDHAINIKTINANLNRRIERMFDALKVAKHVFFIFGETENYKHMMIDDQKYCLTDLSPIRNAIDKTIHRNTFLTTLEKVDSAEKIFQMISDKEKKK